jgi:type II secretory pathway component GspD/PulD (secretin)
MKKLAIVFTLFFALAASALAQLPDDPRFDVPTMLVTQTDGESLRVVIDSFARTVGLTPIINLEDETANKVVIYNIDQEKPFSQIWDILISQEGLDYVVQENDVIVVGTPEAIASLKAGKTPEVVAEMPASVEQKVYSVTKSPEDVAGLIVKVVPGVEAEALPAVGSILVRGTAEQQVQVQSALEQFGAVTNLDPLEQRVFALSNAKASDVAAALQSILSAQVAEQAPVGAAAGEGDAAAADADAGGLQGSGNLRYSVVAYDPTNTVVVRATPVLLDQIAQLIPSLDSAQPQVNVQVRIQEISTSAAEKLGIDLKAGLGNFAATLLDGGLNFIFDAQQAVSGLNIGATLDTLETQQLSRRVDDANITVANNLPGFIQSGGTIYVLLPGVEENIERVIEYGVKITVTPRITADGRIAMQVDAQLDEPKGAVTNANLLELTNRKVTTTVTVEPGQTVLLGGLFSNRFNSTVSGIPILSSIPIIGDAFKTTENRKDNIDLLLVLTADILD